VPLSVADKLSVVVLISAHVAFTARCAATPR
jgi:hypothetical protein